MLQRYSVSEINIIINKLKVKEKDLPRRLGSQSAAVLSYRGLDAELWFAGPKPPHQGHEQGAHIRAWVDRYQGNSGPGYSFYFFIFFM